MALNGAERRRRYVAKKLAELDTGPHPCACGCGQLIPSHTKDFIPYCYARGHSPLARARQESFRFHNKGSKFTQEHRQRISKALKGKPKSSKAIEKRRSIILKNGSYKGKRNPFYGKKHSLQVRRKIGEATSQRNIGKNNPNWKGGIDKLPYGPEFTDRYKKLIRQRDKHRCQLCGKTRKQEGQELAVHHIDHDKMNNDPINLVAVCGKCNTWLRDHRAESLLVFPKRRMLLE